MSKSLKPKVTEDQEHSHTITIAPTRIGMGAPKAQSPFKIEPPVTCYNCVRNNRSKATSILEYFHHRAYLSGCRGWKMPHIIRKLITGSELYNAWNLGYDDWVIERIGTPRTGKDAPHEYSCQYCHDHSLTHEEMKACDEYLAELEREWDDYKANQPSENELWIDQWNDYYEYTGMTDLARESQRRENEMRK